MFFRSWLDPLKSVAPRPHGPRARTRSPCQCPARRKLSLELLEDRSLPSVAPLPISGGFIPNPFGGPDVHQELPGPADSTMPGIGGEPSTINDFNGFVGVVHIQGTGRDGDGHTLLWDADLRFMQGDYRGVDGRLHSGTFAFV